MKINSSVNTSFKGILDSKESISGKYLKYSSPLTKNTQHCEKIYNGKEALNIPYLQYLGGLFDTYVLNGENYEHFATYIPQKETWELGDKIRELKRTNKTILRFCDEYKNNAKIVQQHLLKEFENITLDMISDVDGAFKTTDIETNKTTIAIPSKDNNKLYNVYEFDSLGVLECSLKDVEYFSNGYKAKEVHCFNLADYSCSYNVVNKNGITSSDIVFTYSTIEDKITFAADQKKSNLAILAKYFIEYENNEIKTYNKDAVIFPNGNFNSSERREFYSKDNYSTIYGFDVINNQQNARKAFVFENNKLIRIESNCKQNKDGNLQGERIIVVDRNKKYNP